MLTIFGKDQILEGLLKEEFISFNIRRSPDNISKFPRKVTLLNAFSEKKIIIPGIREKGEKGLTQELKQTQNWQDVTKYSFDISSHLFSLLWRFRENKFSTGKIQALQPLNLKEAQKILITRKRYQQFLKEALTPGKIYLFPDSEVTFQKVNRMVKGYARRVLILSARSDQLTIIPFSTRIDLIVPEKDILFDRSYKESALDPTGRPAVENYPYAIFTQKTALCVHAAQPILLEDFLETALAPKGVIRKEVLNLVEKKLK